MKNFLRSAGVFLRSVPHFLAFELIFKLMLLAIGTPVLTLLLKLTMKLSRITYLNDENIFVYLKHPATIGVIVLMLLAYSIFSFVELSALAACFSCYSRKQRLYTGKCCQMDRFLSKGKGQCHLELTLPLLCGKV